MNRTTTYDYRLNGRLLCQKVREDTPEGKKYKWRRPEGHDNEGDKWIYDRHGVPPILYHADDLREAEEIFVAEGEKCSDAVLKAVKMAGAYPKVAVTTNPDGAGQWNDEFNIAFSGKQVVVFSDNDAPGRKHAARVCRAVSDYALSVKLVEFPELREKGDIADWLQHHSYSELRQLVDATPAWQEDVCADADPEESIASDVAAHDVAACNVSSSQSESQAPTTQLIELGRQAELFITPAGESCARVKVNGHYENHRLRSPGFKQWLTSEYYRQHQRGPSSQATQSALATLDAVARFEGEVHPVFLRVAEANGCYYIDLGDREGRIVELNREGWRLIEQECPPVRFMRTAGMQSLPLPQRGGSIDELRKFLNVASDDDFKLIVAWILASLRPGRPYPILFLTGEQGSAKSTATKVCRRLVDPNAALLRSLPRDARDMAVATSNSHVYALENISWVKGWLSDNLCCLSTGGAFTCRKNYSDDEEMIFQAMRPVIANGISDFASAPDLLDRSITIVLPHIRDNRVAEDDFWLAFDAAWPRLFGALLDAMVVGMRNLPTVRLSVLPRMADFAKWITACEPGLGWKAGSFLPVYLENRANARSIALEASPIAEAVLDFAVAQQQWIGACEQLLHELNARAVDSVTRRAEWPKSARGLSAQLIRVAPELRALGVEVRSLKREAGTGRKLWEIAVASAVTPAGRTPSAASPAVVTPAAPLTEEADKNEPFTAHLPNEQPDFSQQDAIRQILASVKIPTAHKSHLASHDAGESEFYEATDVAAPGAEVEVF